MPAFAGPLKSGYIPAAAAGPNIPWLVDDAKQKIAVQRPVELPSLASRMFHHPGVLGYAMRDQDEYNDAVKHDLLVKRLREIRDQFPNEFANTNAGTGPDGKPIQWGDVPLDQDTTPSPYKWRGISAPGQPMREGSDWLRSVFSIPQNAVRVMGGSVNQAKAESDMAKGLDTALMGIPSMIQGKDANPEWSGDKERPFAALERLTEYPESQGLLEAKPSNSDEARDGITSFGQAFVDIGAPENTATYMVGGLLDGLTDPFPLGPAAFRSAMAKQYGKAAIQAAAEFGPNLGASYVAAPRKPVAPPEPVVHKHWSEYH
jgi:hypothetical protein